MQERNSPKWYEKQISIMPPWALALGGILYIIGAGIFIAIGALILLLPVLLTFIWNHTLGKKWLKLRITWMDKHPSIDSYVDPSDGSTFF